MGYINPLVLTVDEIRDITQYAHWIPIVRGYHHDFIEKRYPGWTWNQFLPVLQRAKLIQTHQEGHECLRLRMGICIKPHLTEFTFICKRGGTLVSAK
jgi:hypothetical protein